MGKATRGCTQCGECLSSCLQLYLVCWALEQISLCPSRKAPFQLYLQSFFLQDWHWELYLPETRDCSACHSPFLDMHTKSLYYSFSGTRPPNKQTKAKKFQQKYKCQSSYPSIHQLCVNPSLDSSWIPARIKQVTSCKSLFNQAEVHVLKIPPSESSVSLSLDEWVIKADVTTYLQNVIQGINFINVTGFTREPLCIS